MIILFRDYNKKVVRLVAQDQDDLWYISELIEPGDAVRSVTSRKVKIGSSDNAKSVKKTFNCEIRAESIEYTGSEVRINGKIIDGPEDAPAGSYQSISIEEKQEFSLAKDNWSLIQRHRLDEASRKKERILLAIFDRDEAIIATYSSHGFSVLFELKGEVSKKDRDVAVRKDFYQEIAGHIEQHAHRLNPDTIILASPAFYKNEVPERLPPKLAAKVITATISAVTASAFNEIIGDPEIAARLSNSAAKRDQDHINLLLRSIAKQDPHSYGLGDTARAVNSGSVRTLLITDSLIKKARIEGGFDKLYDILSLSESSGAQIHILRGSTDPGKILDGLGGIGAILRYAP